MDTKKNDSFIIELWEKVFKILSYISVFSIIKLFRKNITYKFVEIWVLFNTIFSFVSTVIAYYINPKIEFVLWFIMIYGVIRTFEIIIYQMNVLLFDPYRAIKNGVEYKIKSPTRNVILLLHNYFEMVCWFSVVLISSLSINNHIDNSWGYYLRINFLCISTFETDFISNAFSTGGKLSLFAFYETMAGYVISVISLARFIGLLPSVGRIDKN